MIRVFSAIMLAAWLGFVSYSNSVMGCGGSSDDCEGAQALPHDYFNLTVDCYNVWGELIAEWRANGGGVKDSITETRRGIASDNRSKFAAMVRRSWASQDAHEARASDVIGAYPIGSHQHQLVKESISFEATDGIPEDCQSIAWVDSYLLNEVTNVDGKIVRRRRLEETPEDMSWESPYIQQWIRYWMFVKVEG